MFCRGCGAEIAPTARFCPKCGMQNNGALIDHSLGQLPRGDAQQGVFSGVTVGAKAVDGKKRPSSPILIIALVIVVAAIAGIVLFLNTGKSGLSSPEQTMNTYINSALAGDAQATFSTIPDFIIDDALEQSGLTYDEFIEKGASSLSSFASAMQTLKAKVDSLSIGISIANSDYYSSERLQSLNDSLKSKYSGFSGEVSDALDATYDLTISGAYEGKEKSETRSIDATLMKIGGSWYIDPTSLRS